MDEKKLFAPKNKKALSKEEKAVLFLLFVISVLGVYFGFKSFPANLSRPFEVQMASYTGETFKTLTQKEEEEIALQKTSDTDSDGLSDYDELFVYKTSPYLADSDSDGFNDQTEIFSSNNPNCPEGKDCGVADTSVVSETADDSGSKTNILAGVFNLSPTTDSSGITFNSTKDIEAFLAKMTPDEIRAMLISQGVSKDVVDKMTDEQIKTLLSKTIEEAVASGALEGIIPETSDAGETTGSATNPFAGMTSAEIRAALIEQGASKADLDQLTDEQLNQLLEEAASQASSSGSTP